MNKKLVIGITAHVSTILLEGQLAYFRKSGYQTFLLAPDNDSVTDFCNREQSIHLPVSIQREIHFFSDIPAFIQIYRLLKSVEPDIVNLGTPKISLLGLAAAYLLGTKKRIYTCRGFRFEHEKGLKRQILILTEKITSRCAHKVVCISNSVRQYGLDNKIFSPEKSIVLANGSSNGVNLERFNPQKISTDEKNKLLERYNLSGSFIFGFVGRLIDRKGIVELFSAFELLYEQNKNLKLLIVGSVESEQIRDKSLITRMKSHPAVVLTGPQTDVPLYLSLMHVFVLPAWWEGFGNVLIQAAAMGIPVISTDATGSRDAVKNQYNGILVAPREVPPLADAMNLLYNDEGLRIKYGQNGISWAQNFKQELIWENLHKLYSN